MTLTKEFIRTKLLTDDKWLERGITAIWKRQTYDEKKTTSTLYNNGVGFNGCDGPFLTSLGNLINNRCCLSEKQKKYARRKMIKYAGQLLAIANTTSVQI